MLSAVASISFFFLTGDRCTVLLLLLLLDPSLELSVVLSVSGPLSVIPSFPIPPSSSFSSEGAQSRRRDHKSLNTVRQLTPGGGRGGQYTRASSAQRDLENKDKLELMKW